MSSLVEELYRGTLDFNRVNLDLKHLKDRSEKRKIPLSHIAHLIKNVRAVSYQKSYGNGDDAYRIFYPANTLPNYGKIVLGVEVFDNCLNVKTVYEDKLTSSGARRKSIEYPEISKEYELQEKLLRNARYQ